MSKFQISISYFQTIGYLRAKIAEQLVMQINQFDMIIKTQYVDPDENDDKYIKDVTPFNIVLIQKN